MKIKIAVRMSILLTLVVVAIIWFRNDFVAAFRLFRDQLTLKTACGIIFFSLINFFNEPVRWRIILRPRYPLASLTRIYHMLTATALTSYLFPARAGLPVRLFMAKRVLGLDYPTVGALLIIDSVLFYTLWFLAAAIGGAVLMPNQRLLIPAAALMLTASGFALLFVVTHVDWPRLSRSQRLSDFTSRLSTGLKLMTMRVGLINALLLSSDILFYGIRHTLILMGLGVKCSLIEITLIVATSIFAGFVSLMPLGIGGYDVSLAFFLTLIDVPRELAVAVPVINRISMVSVGLILGGISLNSLALQRKS
ncbi:MAG: flippase-like domain-containing protein [Desulfobacteraceae bacterium]|nr:flippase-like domain-containing protein [Desulfobacteraceae bacterium]